MKILQRRRTQLLLRFLALISFETSCLLARLNLNLDTFSSLFLD
uniref:Uncharacterized protein n=1 Tax=Brassica oleracea TaxID=3712 RepID=A0A3P6DDZ2_BRAOL|nr:unnamed protein product [Brassica oleracea]